MKQFNVTGMSCAACSARVEKAVNKLNGVASCSVSLLTNSMSVDGTASDSDIIAAVTAAGYGASIKGGETNSVPQDDPLKDRETPKLIRRLITSAVLLLFLMYVSMGHTMLGLPLPSFFHNNPVALGLAQMLLALAVMIVNGWFFTNGIKGLLNKAPNMDTLVALGSGASFIYSTYTLFAMTAAQADGNHALAESFCHEFYFESAAMILVLITVGKMLEARSKGKTTNALKSLISLAPKTAIVIRDEKELEISTSEIKKGDIFIVKPGASVPADGVVIDGSSAITEAALTGESIPVDKAAGDSVFAATVNNSGYLRCEATGVGDETTLSQIIKMVENASTTKAPIAKIADKVSGIFVPAVITIAVITALIWLAVGETVGFALARGISVLVISCPCALGLATPVAIMVGSGMGAKEGILFKTAAALEEAGRIQIVALDKTGTITHGEPAVTDVIPVNCSESELLKHAYSLEIKSEHPLAGAIVAHAEANDITAYKSDDFNVFPGNGLSAAICGEQVFGGNMGFIKDNAELSADICKKADTLAASGKTPLFFAQGGVLKGIIAVADTVREDSPRAIAELKNMGIHVVMLTGDNERTANAVKEITGVDEVIAGVLPDGKESVIRSLKQRGKTAMVGDGINDAPALTSADIGIAIGHGTDVAIDAADIVLMKSRLSDVPAAIRLSRKALKNIKENLFWAFIYNIIGIPLAAGVWIPLFNLKLNPMFGAAAMSLSSFCVVTNALRLNFFNIHSALHDKKIKSKKEKKNMEKTLKIEGMMCPHCEARVKKALEEISGVTEAIPSHESGNARVILSSDVSDAVLKKAVEDQGYNVL